MISPSLTFLLYWRHLENTIVLPSYYRLPWTSGFTRDSVIWRAYNIHVLVLMLAWLMFASLPLLKYPLPLSLSSFSFVPYVQVCTRRYILSVFFSLAMCSVLRYWAWKLYGTSTQPSLSTFHLPPYFGSPNAKNIAKLAKHWVP
jgi:hypothetical protein